MLESLDFINNKKFIKCDIFPRSFDLLLKDDVNYILTIKKDVAKIERNRCEAIKAISKFANVKSVIIAEKNGKREYQDNVIYHRNNVMTMTSETFLDFLNKKNMPVADTGGEISEINGEKLKKLREKSKLSRKRLGSLAGVSHEMIRRYEANLSNPKPEIAEKLEITLNQNLKTPHKEEYFISLPKNKLILKFESIGMKAESLNMAPFDFIAQGRRVYAGVIIKSDEDTIKIDTMKKFAKNLNLKGIIIKESNLKLKEDFLKDKEFFNLKNEEEIESYSFN